MCLKCVFLLIQRIIIKHCIFIFIRKTTINKKAKKKKQLQSISHFLKSSFKSDANITLKGVNWEIVDIESLCSVSC